MVRPPIAIVVLVVAVAVLPNSHAQDPAAPVNERLYWSAEERPAKPVPPPIVPDHWLVLAKDSGCSAAQVFTRHLLDPQSPPPALAAGGLPWKSAESNSPADIFAAYTRIASERDEVRMARLTGAEHLFVNGCGFVGDADARGYRGVPVALRKGENHVYVLGGAGAFELELWSSPVRVLLATWDLDWPAPDEQYFTYSVFNADVEPVDFLHVHYGHFVTEDANCPPVLTDWADGGRLLPLGVRVSGSYWTQLASDECPFRGVDSPVAVRVSVSARDEKGADDQTLRGHIRSFGVPAPKRRSLEGTTGLVVSRLAGATLPLLVLPADSAESSELLGRVRFDQQVLWYRSRATPEVVHDVELLAHDIETDRDHVNWYVWSAAQGGRYVLYGNSETNKVWSRFVSEDAPIQVRRSSLVVKGTRYQGDDICGWFAAPSRGGKSAVAIADTGVRGARLGYFVQPLFAKTEGLDYCFWDSRGEGGMPRVIASGRFTEAK